MRYSSALLLGLAGFVPAVARAQIAAVITESRVISEQTSGKRDTVFTRSISARGKSRLENSAGIGSQAGVKMHVDVIIVSSVDSEFVMTYVDTTTRSYAQINLGSLMASVRSITGIKMESIGDSSRSDSLGAGPVINGHRTLHFRTRSSSIMRTAIMGDTSNIRMATKSDIYVAADVKRSDFDSVAELSDSSSFDSALAMVPTGMRPMLDLAKKTHDRLAKYGQPLRTLTEVTQTSAGRTRVHRLTVDILRHERVTVPASTFLPPAGYKKVALMDLMDLP